MSFRFKLGSKEYVYCHPGGTAGNLINRKVELYAQKMAKDTEVNKSVITMGLLDQNLSDFVENQES